MMNSTVEDWITLFRALGVEVVWEDFPTDEGNLHVETGLFLNGVAVGHVYFRKPKWSFISTFDSNDGVHPLECLDVADFDQAVAYIGDCFQQWLEQTNSPIIDDFSQSFEISSEDSGFGYWTIRAGGLNLGSLFCPEREDYGYEHYDGSGGAHSLEDAKLSLLHYTYHSFAKIIKKIPK